MPAGRRVGILTNAGGPGILAADACEGRGLRKSLFGQTRADAPNVSPRGGERGNPVDMLASATAADYDRSLRVMLAHPEGIDSVLAIYVPPMVTTPAEVATVIAAAANGAS